MFSRLKSNFVPIALMLASLMSVGCGRVDDPVLSRAEAMMEAQPDSVILMLRRDSARICAQGRAERMTFRLLLTEAEDKCLIIHKSDSAMLAVTNYFDWYGDARRKARSTYLLGRVNCDIHQYATALNCFDDVLSLRETNDSVINRYKARSASWAADVYENLQLYEKNLYYCKQQYYYALRSDAPSIQVYALRDIGRAYGYLNNTRAAVNYYQKAAEKAKTVCSDDELYNMVMDELAGYYLENGMTDEARKVMADKPYGTIEQDLAMHNFVKADYYDQIGKKDSSILYFEEGLKHGSLSAMKDSYLKRAKSFSKSNDSIAVKYYEKFVFLSEKTAHEHITVYKDFVDNIEKNFDAEEDKVAMFKSLVLMIVIVLIVAILLIILFVRYKKHQREISEQRQRIKEILKQRDESDIHISENEAQIQKLEQILSESNETITELNKKLVQAKSLALRKQNEQIKAERHHKEMLREEFFNSELYHRFHTQGFMPNKQDFQDLAKELNRVYDNFTLNLKEACPKISVSEIEVCCLIKIGLSMKVISNMTVYRLNSLAMLRKRLYEKVFHKKGTALDWDKYIKSVNKDVFENQ